MKRNFLLMLLLTLLPFVGWAQGIYVTVQAGGGYTAQLHQTETYVFGGKGLPKVDNIYLDGEPVSGTITPALDGTYKVVKSVGGEIQTVESVNGQFNPLTVGNYYLEFTITGTNTVKTVYVPFQVGQEFTNYEFIWNEQTFEQSCEDGALALYYEAYPECAVEKGDWDRAASVNDSKYTNHEGFPWIAFKAPTTGSYKVMFTYDNEEGLTGLNNPCMPWYEKQVQTFGSGTNDRKFGLASVVERTSFNHFDWQIGVDPTATNTNVGPNPNPDGPEEGAFNVNEFHMYWMPAENITEIQIDPQSTTLTDISGYTWAVPVITFNGAEQKLDALFTDGTAKVLETASSTTPLVFGTDFTVTYVEGADYTNAGEGKSVTITGIGNCKGSFTKTYTIAPFELTSANFSLNPEGPFQYDGTDKKPDVLGRAYLNVESDEVTQLNTVAGADFTTILYKDVTDGDDTEVTQAKEAGDYYYIVTPKGNYKAAVVDNETVEIKLSFTVTGLDLSNSAVVVMPTVTQGELTLPGYVYNTKEQKPVFTTTSTATADAIVKYTVGEGDQAVTTTLVEGTDFEVAQELGADYTNVGEKEIIIIFKGSYEGRKTVPYAIFAKNIDEIDQKTFNAPTYNPEGGAQISADNFDFKYNNVALVLVEDGEGDFTWDWKDGSDGESAGAQTIVVTGNGNYTGTTEVGFNLKPYAVTITPAKAEKEYGQPDPAPNFTIDANSSSKIEYNDEQWRYIQSFLVMERNTNDANNSDELRECNVEGGHKYAIRLKDTEEPCNYEILIQNNDGILFINPAPLTVKVAKNSKTYGDADPNFTEDKDANNKFQILYGTEDKTNAKDFVDETKNLKDVLKIGRVAGEDVKDSPYDFTWDNDNYKVTFEPTGFTITPKQVTIDVAFDDNGYEYKGEEWNPTPRVTIKGTETELTNLKDFAVTWAPGTGANDLINVTEGSNVANNRWPSGTVSQVTNGNYTFSSVQAYFKITQATLEIEAISDNKKAYTGIEGTDPTPLAMLTFAQGKGPKGRDTYQNGECNFIVTGTNTPIFYKNGNKNAAAPLIIREKGEHTGDYEISINPDVRTRNYNIVSTATANFLIYRTDEIVISFDSPKEITYGDEPDLTSLIEITAPTGVNTADLKNYLDQNVKKYQLIDPETGEVDNEKGEKTYIETNNVGTYHLTIDDVPTAYKNYDVRLTEGILKILHFPLYIRAVDSKEYGDKEPVTYDWAVYEITGYKNQAGQVVAEEDATHTIPVYAEVEGITPPDAENIGNTGDRLTDLWNYTISRERGEDVGHYATTIRNSRLAGALGQRTVYYNTQYDGNYSFTFAQGDFEITRRALTVAVEGASKFYGEYDPVKVDNEWVLSADLDENEDDNVSVFTKGLVKITITNALPSDLEMIANKVTFTHRDAGEVVKAGGYQVKNVNFDGVNVPGATRLANYTLSYSNNANFMINKRVLKVIAHDQSVPYANPLVIAPYDLTITEGILLDNEYKTYPPTSKAILYDANVTTMPQANATDSKAINDRVDQVFKPLEVADDCPTNVGEYHKNAFKLELTEFGNQNYVLEFTNGKVIIEQATDLYLDMANLAQALNDHKGRTVTLHMVGAPNPEEGCSPTFREFGARRWYTLVLPFRGFVRDIVKPFEYGVIDVLKEDNTIENSFSLSVTTARVEANTPFIIQVDKNWRTANMQGVKWENVTIADDFDYVNEDPTAEDAAGNKFVGTYKPKSEFTDANYVMKDGTGEFSRWYNSDPSVVLSYDMKQTEAYLQSSNAAAAARIFIDEEDGSTTAIDFVEGETKAINAEGAYNLSGQRVSKAQKGILIIDGKKVAFK